MAVTVVSEPGCGSPYPLSRFQAAALVEAALRAMNLEGGAGGDVDLSLVGEARMAELNAQFLGRVGPTNVLSFPGDDEGHLGSLVISPTTLRREARVYGQDPRAHALRLIVHGALHLAGHEHGPGMEAAQRVVLAKIGLAAARH